MTEGRFVSEFVRNVRDTYPGAFVRQHFTPPRGQGLRFLPETPFDFYVLFHGGYLGVEAKQVKGASLPLDRYRPQQTKSLLEVCSDDAGGLGCYLVNVRELAVERAPLKLQPYARGGKVNCCLVLYPSAMASAVADSIDEGRKSITVQMLADRAYKIAGRKGNAWDVKSLLSWALGE